MLRRLKKVMQKWTHKSALFNKIYNYLSSVKTACNMKLDDETFFKRRYREYFGKEINLDNPKTFNEKLLWLQIHDRKPEYTMMTDKYLVKEWVANKIGAQHVVPLIGVWNSPEEIPFEELPDEYVLKCNHDCGSVFIKQKGQIIDKQKIIKTFQQALKRNYYHVGRVWGYKNIAPKVFCEEFIHSADTDLPRDYKIFCFNGVPRMLFVASDRGKGTKFDFFDTDWNRIPVKQHYPNSTYDLPKPSQLSEMLDIAKKLSEGIPQVRVDLYIDANDTILFGEMTFCHFSGTEAFEPEEYDEIFGSYCDISGIA